jgi:hypothetical protein
MKSDASVIVDAIPIRWHHDAGQRARVERRLVRKHPQKTVFASRRAPGSGWDRHIQ